MSTDKLFTNSTVRYAVHHAPFVVFCKHLVFGACRHTSTFSGRRPHPCQAAKAWLSCMSLEHLCTQFLALLSAKVAEPNTPCFPPSLRCAAAAGLFICTNSLCSAASAIPSFAFDMPVAHCNSFQDCKTWSFNQQFFHSQAIVKPSFPVLLCHFTSGHSNAVT